MRLLSWSLLRPAITLLACLHGPAVVANELQRVSAPQVRAVLAPGASDAPFSARAVLVPVAPPGPLTVHAQLSPSVPKAACDAPDLMFADGFEDLVPI